MSTDITNSAENHNDDRPRNGFWLRLLDWYLRHFLTGFCYYLILPLVLLLILALLLGKVPGDFGIDQLVRHDDETRQLVVGLSLSLLWLHVLFVGYLLWLRDRREERLGHADQIGPTLSFGGYGGYAVRMSGCLLLTVVVLAGIWEAVNQMSRAPAMEGLAQPSASRPQCCLLLTGLLAPIALLCLPWPVRDDETLGAGPGACLWKWLNNTIDGPPASIRMRCVTWILLLIPWLFVGFLLEQSGEWWQQLLRLVVLLLLVLAILLAAWRPHSRPWFVFLEVVYALLAYAAVTWVLSRAGGLAATCAALAVLLLGVAAVVICRPEAARAVRERWRERREGMHAVEAHCERWSVPWVLGGIVLFGILCFVPALASPVPVGCFFLFGLVTAYGVFVYVIRRSLPVALAALVFFALLGGLPWYPFRFPGLEDLYHGQQRANLARLAADDHDRQCEFNCALAQLQASELYAANLWDSLKDRTALSLIGQGSDDDATWLDTLRKLIKTGKEIRTRRAALREPWQQMEQNNRVIAGRLLRHDLHAELFPPDAARPLRTVYDLLSPEAPQAPPSGKPLVLIAVKGGGLRSAAWTLTVLQKIEEEFAKPFAPYPPVDFPKHVRVIAGASGGMLGAAYYVAALDPPAQRAKDKDRKEQMDGDYEKLTRDHLTPIVQQYVFGDLPNSFSPWPTNYDRGRALEESWSREMDGKLDVTFQELRRREGEGWLPSLVLTPMMIEDGRRLVISNLDLRWPISNDGNLLRDPGDAIGPHYLENYSRDAVELFRLFPGKQKDFHLSTAVRMSASFPFFSPAVSLPTVPRRRVVDAGYFDNYGVNLATAWLCSPTNVVWIKKHYSKIVLIQIRDGLSAEKRSLTEIDDSDTSGMARAFEGLSTPVEGLEAGRIGSSSFRNDKQLELLSAFIMAELFDWQRLEQTQEYWRTPEQVARNFTVVTFEYPGKAALSWYLSKAERDEIRKSIDSQEFRDRITLLRRWWHIGE